MHFCQNNCKTRLRASSSVPGQTVWLGYCPTTNLFLKIKVGFHCSVQTINLLVLVPLKKKIETVNAESLGAFMHAYFVEALPCCKHYVRTIVGKLDSVFII